MSERSPLEIEIRRRIATAGPMPVAEYMALCLLDRQHGYYVTRDPLGARGDFTTAPEVSQMFGELIGLGGHCVDADGHTRECAADRARSRARYPDE